MSCATRLWERSSTATRRTTRNSKRAATSPNSGRATSTPPAPTAPSVAGTRRRTATLPVPNVPAGSVDMSIEINNESGVEIDEPALQRLATFALDHLHVHRDAELAILLVDEAAM